MTKNKLNILNLSDFVGKSDVGYSKMADMESEYQEFPCNNNEYQELPNDNDESEDETLKQMLYDLKNLKKVV